MAVSERRPMAAKRTPTRTRRAATAAGSIRRRWTGRPRLASLRGEMRVAHAVALTCALLVEAAPALAQDAKDRARVAYREGENLSRQRRYAEAARAFAEADTLVPNDTALEAALEAAL